MKKLLAMMVGVAAVTASARTAELNWFDNPIAGMSAGAITTGAPWTAPSDGDATVKDVEGVKHIELDTDLIDQLVYTPTTSTDQRVVTIRAEIQATVNMTMPEASTFNGNQAVLTVATNTTANKLQWVGLVKSGDAAAWQYFDEPTPTADQSYQVKIEIDNSGATKLIRYTVGETVLGDGWYLNPQASATTVSAVAFAGTGNVASFNGKTVQEGGVITSAVQTQGYDFTNGTVAVNVSSPIEGAKAVLTYTRAGGTSGTIEKDIGSTTSVVDFTSDLKNLVPGGVTTYTIDVKVGNEVYATQHGTFMSANSDAWFKADASADPALENAAWDTNADVPTITSSKYMIDGDSQLNVADAVTNKCANLVSTVETSLKYTSLIDSASLETVSDAIGGFSAVSDNNGQWVAMTGSGWVTLEGAAAPQTNVDYVIRAEFDFTSGKRIRYSVKTGSDGFIPLTNGGDAWINMITQKNALEAVLVSGSGELAKIDGQIADPSIAAVGDVKYATLWEALRASNTVKLLTNATLNGPGAFTGTFTITKNGFELESGVFGPDMKATITDNGNTYTVEVEAAPQGAVYLIY